MRLSEAMRLGAMLHPQCFGILRVRDLHDVDQILQTCALGAAYAAGYVGDIDGVASPGRVVSCPHEHCEASFHLYGIITHLNDDHHWTREAIADWVATIEASETPTPHAATSDVRGTAVGG